MKITIDTESKTIQLSENVNIKALIKFLKKHFDDWNEYEIIHHVEYVPYNPYPIWQPYIQCDQWITTTGELTVDTTNEDVWTIISLSEN